MMSTPLRSKVFFVVFLVAVTVAGCSSDKGARQDQNDEGPLHPTMTTEEDEEGFIVERLDTNADGHTDIIRYFEEYQHPRDDSRVERRLKKMEIDVTGDQKINVRRYYDNFGNVQREENDLNLNGTMDSFLYFVGGELVRKELMDETGERLRERRIYLDGRISRVELDRHGDGQIDRWEYYEDGVLVRIGRDTLGDGSVDTWQLR